MSEIKPDVMPATDALSPDADGGEYHVDGFELFEQWVEPGEAKTLFYRGWLSDEQKGSPREHRKAVVLLHRGHEHSGRMAHLIGEVAGRGVDYFAWDARGHGRSEGRRGFADDFAQKVSDLHHFVETISQRHDVPVQNIIVVANSVASVVASTWLHDYAPQIRAIVLVAPAFRVKLYVPFALTGLRLLDKVNRDAVIKSYVKPLMLTSDKAMADDYANDPLVSRDISNHILVGMYDAAKRIIEDAAAIHTPLMVLSAGKDAVVRVGPQRRFFERVGSAAKVHKHYPTFKHAILHEKDRAAAIGDIRAFINARFDEPTIDLTQQMIAGDPASRVKAESLAQPLSPANPKSWYWTIGKVNLRIGGWLSKGIGIGYKYGFDSGQSLDHVYLNTAEGAMGVGCVVDWLYINSIGWKGIRQRKVNLQAELDAAITSQQTLREGPSSGDTFSNPNIRVVDVASGPGRYMIEQMRRYEGDAVEVTALCRDFSESGVAQGSKTARELGVKRIEFEQGDAFDPQQLRSLTPKPAVVVVSGLYELFDDNELILQSLRGIAEGLDEQGTLIYTNQPWHPQQEMIARMLPNREGDPWVMRCRSQLEMDTLVREAGFEKKSMRIDQWGIFTVSTAVKVASGERAG